MTTSARNTTDDATAERGPAPPPDPRRAPLPAEHDEPGEPRATKPSPRGRRNRWRLVGRWVKRGFLLLLVVGVVALLVRAWLPKPVEVDAQLVERGPMSVTVDEDGRTRVKDRYVISAPLSGRVARIELSPGDPIDEKTVLARIVPVSPPLLDERSQSTAESRVAAAAAAQKQIGAQIVRAEASLEFAKGEQKKIEGLVASGVAASGELDRARLTVRTAAAELDSLRFGAQVAAHEVSMARAALGHLTKGRGSELEQLAIPAPAKGRVLKVLQQSEGVVQAGTPLLEVGDPGALEIVVDVLTRDGIRIAPGAKVTIDRWGGEPLEAHVRLVEPAAFTRLSALGVEEQRVNVIVDLDAPRERWAPLGDGYRVEAHITVWHREDAVRIPASAAFRRGDGWAVFVIDGGVARLTPVELGQRNGREAEVVSGLEPPISVVLHPSDRVRDGVEVTARNVN